MVDFDFEKETVTFSIKSLENKTVQSITIHRE